MLVLVGGALLLVMVAATSFTVADSLGRTTDVTPLDFGASITAVHLDLHAGAVTIRGSDRATVTGERRVTHGLETPTFHEQVADGTLTITGGCPAITGLWCNVSYVLDVPAGAAITVDNGTGRVDVSGVTGAVSVRSGAGSVRLDDVAGQLDARSGAGSITATRVRSTIVTADSGAGSVDLTFVAAPEHVKASAGAGSVDIEVPRDNTTYRVPTSSRHNRDLVEVATNPEAPRSIDAEAGAGQVRIHYPAR